jgi:hypothetical protein
MLIVLKVESVVAQYSIEESSWLKPSSIMIVIALYRLWPLEISPSLLSIIPKHTFHPRFTHGANEWAQCPNLTARELAMLCLIEALTEKSNRNVKVFNREVVAKWREKALAMPLISTKIWD